MDMHIMESLDIQDQEPTTDEKNLALLSHIGTLFGGFVVPLVVWLMKKDESRFISDHAKESLNFQISLLIYVVASFVLVFIIVGFFLLFALGLFAFITTLMGTVAASSGKPFRYPLCIRLIQ
jgi:uncharacterized Tic20 family protein